DGEDAILPLVEVTEEDVRRIGSAVFRDTRMVGTLSLDEDWALMQARGVNTAGEVLEVTLPSGGSVSAEIFSRNRQIHIQWADNRPEIDLRIRLEAILQQVVGGLELTPTSLAEIGDALSA